ncbi:MAG TPA: hypothetical protein VGO25_08985, partial [Rhodanobacteraceae bacterium]|nr:hypothetical protein [Rhodanobacteraceae bacterium]
THSPSQYDNYISQNTALGQDSDGGYGGGIEVLGPAVANFSSVLALNTAPNGGGIAAIATENGPATVNVYTTDPNSPVSIYGNIATGWGGGIYLRPYIGNQNDARLCMNDFALDANTASDGSALYLWHDGYLGAVAYLNTPSECTPAPDAVACAPGTACNEMNDNVTQLEDGTPTDGSTVRVMLDGAFSASRFAARRNNSHGGNLIEFFAESGVSIGRDYVRLHDCVLADNIVGDHLLNGEQDGNGTQMILDTCTVANNQLSGGAAMAVIGADVNFIEVTNSIVYQPDHEVVEFHGAPGDLTSEYVLTNSAASLSGGFGIVEGTPAFVDVANGDYHLVRTSPGVDMAPVLGDVDLDGNPRAVDLLDIPNGWGTMDVGAYEIQTQIGTCAISDTIFCNGFDGL